MCKVQSAKCSFGSPAGLDFSAGALEIAGFSIMNQKAKPFPSLNFELCTLNFFIITNDLLFMHDSSQQVSFTYGENEKGDFNEQPKTK